MNVNEIVEMAKRAESLSPPEVEYQDDEAPEVRGPWMPSTIQDVDWALRRKAECEKEAAEIDSQLSAAISAARERADALKAKALRGAAFFELRLSEWANANKAEIVRGKRKSREFLHGKISFRESPAHLEVTDKNALRDWLLSQPVEAGLYRIKPEPEMAALQEHFRLTGEVPPGTTPIETHDNLTVKATLPGDDLATKG